MRYSPRGHKESGTTERLSTRRRFIKTESHNKWSFVLGFFQLFSRLIM